MNSSEEKVILVDEHDQVIGLMGKMEAHRKALLHRAFSVFIFNEKDELLIHQRADGKYHSAGLWTNTCCSHPYSGEIILHAAQRRLKEEMGFSTNLEKAFHFIYKTELENGLSEHEFDHVFIGRYSGEITPEPEEVQAWKWINMNDLIRDMEENPKSYTVWFKIALPKIQDFLAEKKVF